jgi:hypothetical protein
MITPTVGRVILFHPAIAEGQTRDPDPYPGFVCRVNPDGTINVGGFNAFGTSYGQNNVQLLQDDEAAPATAAYAEWMPYQKGQAAKPESILARMEAEMKEIGHHAYDYLFGKKAG